jgi:acyltransferase
MRLDFIDNAKAIAILLVIIGHTDGIPQYFENLIFSFHMPAFFFISGYLIKDYKLCLTLRNYTNIQIKTLIIPYVFFGLISICYSVLNNFVKGVNSNIYKNLYGLLYGNSEGLVNTVLWFFTCLFSTSLIYFIFSRIARPITIVILSLITGLVICYFHNNLDMRPPWNIDLSLISLFFFASGKCISEINIKQPLLKENEIKLFLAIIIPALFYLSGLNGRIDMAFMSFGNPVLFIVNACLGIAILLILGSLLPITEGALYLSRSTIVIFPVHPIIFSVFTGIGMIIFRQPHDFQDSILWAVVYTCGAIIFSYPISIFFFRFFPIAIGGRKKA